jgi:hypothetical protein
VQEYDFKKASTLSRIFSADRATDRLAAALWPNRDFPEVGTMAMFSACFDAAGDWKSQPFVIASGFVANLQQWGMFGALWKRAHAESNMELPLHMTELMAARNNPERYAKQKDARPDYIRLALQGDDAVNEFLHHLALTEVTSLSCGISCIVPTHIYNEVDAVLCLSERIPPYALAARMCIEKLHQWEKTFAIAEPAEYIFEYGDFGQGKFTDLMIDEGQAIPIYKHKNEFLGLQGADHYAWEQSSFLKKWQRDPIFIPRQELSFLIHAIPKLHVEATQETLIRVCEAKGIKPRK